MYHANINAGQAAITDTPPAGIMYLNFESLPFIAWEKSGPTNKSWPKINPVPAIFKGIDAEETNELAMRPSAKYDKTDTIGGVVELSFMKKCSTILVKLSNMSVSSS